jgi:hypothetical protein
MVYKDPVVKQAAEKALRRRYRADGLCWYCPCKAVDGKSMCYKHLRKNREANQRYREREAQKRLKRLTRLMRGRKLVVVGLERAETAAVATRPQKEMDDDRLGCERE